MREEKAVLLRLAFHLFHVLRLGLAGRSGLGPQEGREREESGVRCAGGDRGHLALEGLEQPGPGCTASEMGEGPNL